MKLRRDAAGLCAAALAAALALPGAASAAFPSGADVERSDETGKVRFVGMQPGRPDARPSGLDRTASPAAVARAYLRENEAALGLDGPSALRAAGTVRGARGGYAVRYRQTLKGVEVLGGEFAVRLDADRNVLSLLGEAVPGGDAFDAEPALGPGAAERAAVGHVAEGEGVARSTLRATPATLKVFDARILGGPGREAPVLVYATTVGSERDPELKRLVFVDADTGSEVATIDETHEAKERHVCDAANTDDHYPCMTPVLSEGGTYAGPGAADVQAAYDYSGATYDFFRSRFGRDGLNGNGLAMKSTVRWCRTACPYRNAFWDGEQMVYGPGFASADDVVGHELAHGLTDYTSNLFYYYQSGAINESLSDVFGEFVDQVTASPNDAPADRWYLGESLAGGPIRNLQNPPQFGDPDRMGSPHYDLDEDENDDGGVHTNSGVGNKAAYLIAEGGTGGGIGIEKTARLFYVVATEFLVSGSDYADLGSALGQACDNLVGTAGFTAADCGVVRDAVATTEMLTGTGGASDEPACAAGQSPSYVSLEDFEGTVAWTWTTGGEQDAWQRITGYAASGRFSLFGADLATTSDSSATGPVVAIPSGAFLRFRHSYAFEDDPDRAYDGGVVEYSENGGASWIPLPDDYPGTIASGFGNPLSGRAAYVRESRGYVSESVSLAALAGKSVQFRFRIGTDANTGDLGWDIDDVGVHTCGTDATDPETTITGGPAEGSVGHPADVDVAFASSELGSTFVCAIDGGRVRPCRSPEALRGLAAGSHTVSVRAVDPAGRADPTPAMRTFTVGTPARQPDPENPQPEPDTGTPPGDPPGDGGGGGTGGTGGGGGDTDSIGALLTQDVADFIAALRRAGGRRLARRGSFSARADVARGGLWTIRVTARRGGRKVLLATARRRFIGVGGATVRVRLTRAGRTLLRRARGRVPVAVTVSFTPLNAVPRSAAGSLRLRR